MNAQLNTAPSIVTEIAEYSQTAAALSDLRHRYLGVAFNVTTTKGMDEAKKARQEVKGYRTALEAKRKEIKAPALERCRLIDDEAKTITAALLELEEPIDGQIKAEEARKEAEKAAKAEAERQRMHGIRVQIDAIKNHSAFAVGKSADAILKILSGVEGFDVGDDFQELRPEAEAAKADTLAKLKDLHAAQVEHEAEQARIAAERAELARLRAEAEAREREAAAARVEQERKDHEARQAVEAEQAAKLAAARAAQAEELRKQREAQEAEMRAQREAQAKADAEAAAARRAEEARLAAERAELRRMQDEADAKRRADEEAKHAADIKARNAAPVMLAALQQIAELSTEAKVKKIAAAAIKEAL
jgi:colicin import membrane protein